MVELGGIDVDVDHLHVLGEARRLAELDHVVEPGADHQQHVGLGEGLDARVEERELVVLGDGAAGDRRRVERDAAGVDELAKLGGGVRPPHAAAADDQRPLGLGEERDRFLHGARIAERARQRLVLRREAELALVDGLAQHVAGQVEVDRPRLAGGGVAEGARHQVGNAARVHDLLRPLGDRLEHADLVDLLEGVHVLADGRARAADGDERRRVGPRVGHARHEVGGAGAGAAHAHARALLDPPPRVGRVRGRLLVVRVDGADAHLDQGALRLEHGPAHQEEQRVAALVDEGAGEDLGAGEGRHRSRGLLWPGDCGTADDTATARCP